MFLSAVRISVGTLRYKSAEWKAPCFTRQPPSCFELRASYHKPGSVSTRSTFLFLFFIFYLLWLLLFVFVCSSGQVYSIIQKKTLVFFLQIRTLFLCVVVWHLLRWVLFYFSFCFLNFEWFNFEFVHFSWEGYFLLFLFTEHQVILLLFAESENYLRCCNLINI